MYVPPNMPVRVGQPIRLSASSFNRAAFLLGRDEQAPSEQFAGAGGQQDLDATIVRVARGNFVGSGQIAVGVKFTKPIS